MRLTVLGARGSVPVHGASYEIFGGATTSYLIEAGDLAVFIDAGTGIAAAEASALAGKKLAILLTHPHLDHLSGLPFFPPLSEPGRRIDVYGAKRQTGGAKERPLAIREQLDALYRPPLWPCGIADYPADIQYHTISYQSISEQVILNTNATGGEADRASVCASGFVLGDVAVDAMEVPHPGGCTAYRLRHAGRSVVVVTDAELPMPGQVSGAAVGEGTSEGGGAPFDPARFLAFLRGADWMLCDSQYTEEEAARRAGFGHSTAACAIAWKDAAGVKRLLLVHHDPAHDDAFLNDAEQRIGRADVRYARAGETVT